MPPRGQIRDCAVSDCPERIRAPAVLCPAHWSMVPDVEQKKIGDAILDGRAEDGASILSDAVLRIRAVESRRKKSGRL